MNKLSIKYQDITLDVLALKTAKPARAVLFAAGSGGNPERHLPLLNSLLEHNCTVVAPYFERIVSPMPKAEELLLRINSLQAALSFIDEMNVPTVGVGHSIGATLLLALAGGQMWMQAGQPLPIIRNDLLKKVVLFAPPTGFFQAPNALDAVQSSIQVWVGSLDTITPPQQIEILKKALPKQVSLDIHLVDGAGHFSFMNTLPPNMVDPMGNREEFLTNLAADVCRFIF